MTPDPSDVRYVCLSDLHLGEADSVLTPLKPDSHDTDTSVAGPLLEALVACIEHTVSGNRGNRRPILILNGDALELAFGTFNQALTHFERLATLLLDRELVERAVYIPGNHDHHIWEVARETQYAEAVIGQPFEESLPPLRHVTSLRLEEAVPAYLLNKIIRKIHPPHEPDDPGHEVLVVYPNLAILDEAADRCILFHHGHYVEPLYHAFSKLRRWLFPDRPLPETVDEIEEENFAWIEFVWSLLGRSGGAGADMRTLFRMLRDAKEFAAFRDDLAHRVAVSADIPWVPGDMLERFVVKRAINWVGPKLSGERSRRQVVHSPEVRRGIERYLFGPAYRQLREEVGRVPGDLTFVFGHTHKPYEAVLADPAGGGEVKVYNTGGWPIDSMEPSPAMGASILFMNERLEVASLRVYNDSDADGEVCLDVRAAAADEIGSEFRAAIAARVRGADGAPAEPWRELEGLIHGAIVRRRRHHSEATT